ncbi:MAG: glycosyltransferase family 1 protein [Gaiellaceae bacterium]|jgi:glycosyltransferase involved in cell wall biosynthesis
MKVALDVRWLRRGRVDGIGRVVLSLVPELVKDRSIEWTLLYHEKSSRDLLEPRLESVKVRWERVPFPILSATDLLKLPGFLRELGVDTYLTFNYVTSPLHRGYRSLAVVQDLIQFHYKEGVKQARGAMRIFYATRLPTRLILSRLDRLIAPSQNTARDLSRLFGVDERKVSVIPWGAERPPELSDEELQKGLAALNLDKDYILYVGRYEPYKNVGSLIEAHQSLSRELRGAHPLVLVGNLPDDLKVRIAGDRQIRAVGQLESLEAVYMGAALFVFPSKYEGFGLPPLEAMTRGIPVVTTHFASLPEVGGDAAIQTDGTPPELAKAIEQVLTDQKLSQKLIAAGGEQAQRFSWQKTAEQVTAILSATQEL